MANDLAALVPARVVVAFPAIGTGAPSSGFFEITVALSSLGLTSFQNITGSPWKQLLHRYETATYSESATPTNNSSLEALATQIASDWYKWQLAPLDQYFSGVSDWTPEGFHNLEWSQQSFRITTHVQRRFFNPSEDLLVITSPMATDCMAITDVCNGLVRYLRRFSDGKVSITDVPCVHCDDSGSGSGSGSGPTPWWCVSIQDCTISGEPIEAVCCPGVNLSTVMCVTYTNVTNAPLYDGIDIVLVWDGSLSWTPPDSAFPQSGYWVGKWIRVDGCPTVVGDQESWITFTFGCSANGNWFWNSDGVTMIDGTGPPVTAPSAPNRYFDSSSCDPFNLTVTSNLIAAYCYDSPFGPFTTSVQAVVSFCGGSGGAGSGGGSGSGIECGAVVDTGCVQTDEFSAVGQQRYVAVVGGTLQLQTSTAGPFDNQVSCEESCSGSGCGGLGSPTVDVNTTQICSDVTTLTITGTNFNTTPANNTVTLTDAGAANVPNTVTASSSTSITMTLTSPPIANVGAMTAFVVCIPGGMSNTAQVATVIDCGGSGTPIWNDTFTDADGTDLDAHTADLWPGGSYYSNQSMGAGVFEIQSNTLTPRGVAGTTVVLYWLVDPVVIDVTGFVRFTVNDEASVTVIAFTNRDVNAFLDNGSIVPGSWSLAIDNGTTLESTVVDIQEGVEYTMRLHLSNSADDALLICNGVRVSNSGFSSPGSIWALSVETTANDSVTFHSIEIEDP